MPIPLNNQDRHALDAALARYRNDVRQYLTYTVGGGIAGAPGGGIAGAPGGGGGSGTYSSGVAQGGSTGGGSVGQWIYVDESAYLSRQNVNRQNINTSGAGGGGYTWYGAQRRTLRTSPPLQFADLADIEPEDL
jgi:hypothetical protein